MGKTRSLLILSVINSAVYGNRLLGSLALIYLGLRWKVRKARRAFEKELIKQGMPKQDAKRISAKYSALKNEAINAIKAIFWSSRKEANVSQNV